LHGFFAYQDIRHASVAVSDVAISANARYAVTCSNAFKGILVWDLEAEKRLASYVGHEDAVSCVALTSSSRYAVSGSRDGSLKIWNLVEGKEHVALVGHSGGVGDVAIDSEERLVVSASGDETLRVWDVRTGEQIACLTGETIFMSCAISGKRIVAGDTSGCVHFLELEGFEP
jgi:WD40 repeat protein